MLLSLGPGTFLAFLKVIHFKNFYWEVLRFEKTQVHFGILSQEVPSF